MHTNIQGMVQDAFQQVDQLNILEEISIEVVEKTFVWWTIRGSQQGGCK